MSWIGDRFGIHVKVPGLAQVGGLVDKGIQGAASIQSNPWVQGLEAAALGATGVGAPAAAAILAASGGISGLAKKGSTGLGDALSGAVKGGIAGYGGDKLGAGLSSAFSSGGATGVAKALGTSALGKVAGGGGAPAADPGYEPDYDLYGNPIEGTSSHMGIPGLPTGVSDAVDGIGSYLKNNAGTLLPLGLGVASGINGADLQKQSSDALKKGLATAQGSYDARAPLRALGIAQLQNPTPSSDISGLATMNAAGNPFVRPGAVKFSPNPGAPAVPGLAKPLTAVA